MAKFCMNCGASLADKALFCPGCGQKVEQPAAPAQPTYQQPVAPAQPVYQQPVYVAPARPGRTQGIVALVLAIFCFLASLSLSVVALVERYAEEDINTIGNAATNMVQDMYGNMGLPSHITDQATNAMNSATNAMSEVYGNLADRVFETYLPFFIGVMVLSAVAILFSILALKNGYRNSISVVGLLMAIVSIVIVVVSMIVIKSDGGSDAESTTARSFTCALCAQTENGSGNNLTANGQSVIICDDCYAELNGAVKEKPSITTSPDYEFGY